MSVNWQDLIDTAGETGALPAGEYDVRVDSAEAGSSSTGKTMFKCKFTVVGGPLAGRPVWNNFVLSPENPNALSFFFQHMGALGLSRDFFASNPTAEATAQALVGRECRLKLSQREWNGSTRNNVDTVMPPAGGIAAPVAPQADPMNTPVAQAPDAAAPVAASDAPPELPF